MDAHDTINAANAEAARTAGWPELTGTDKQLGWATTARANKVREFETMQMRSAEKDWWRKVLLRELLAGAWIDNRYGPWQALAIINLNEEERADLLAGRFANR
ncbi:hypothetical protein [Nocardia sp. CS682]|uniref:hypothetical protein n=1 Tax=Nocardia sp. CS682 TaxID=1047172 RepID=UPI001075288C|nr:hypothetical protein [Nocardia sp. CS682]QBS45282.1 hypothetical protein DMB37_39605 [Nocardia sp. CS682]